MVGHHHHRMRLQETLDATRRRHHPCELLVGERERAQLPLGAVLVGVPVVVGQREQQEVEQVVLDHVGGDAAGVLVAHAGHPQAPSGSRCDARRRCRRRTARGGPSPRGAAAWRRRSASARSRAGARGGGGRGRSGRSYRRCARRRRRAPRTPSAARARGGRGSCCRPCRSAGARSRSAARHGRRSRTPRSGPPRGGTSSSPGIRWRSWPAPVVIDAAHTGVTEGKAAAQSGT